MPRSRTRSGRIALVLTLAAVGPLAYAGFAQAHDPDGALVQNDQQQEVSLDQLHATSEEVATGLARPTALTGPDDGSGELLITEKAGTVRAWHPDAGLAEEPLVDITERVNASGNERGLLGIATAADYADTQELYLAYTAQPEGTVTLARHHVGDDDHEILIEQEHPEFTNHNGGQLAFGADGHLFWSLGDGGGAGDPDDNGQSTDTLLGKILRIDVSQSCGELPYCVPEENPFVDDPQAHSEIWTYGVRNAWKFSVDPADDSLWIADVGQGGWEEVNHLAADEGGANLGWSCYEGFEVFDEERCREDEEYTDPVFTYGTSVEGCAIIGGHVYRGERYADIAEGVYVASDYCTATVFALQENADGTYEEARIGELPTQVSAFGTSAEGELYMVNDLPGGLHAVGFTTAGGEG